ncbi:class I SAM-dependent methyltransferase [Acaryochloris sp. IP29b_bin.137]|uniref:class I SAM-dependent methyltransferase n=1 Tax=Acaryochloris sp. IP29b_bin.137 TaxID=2969217 RepID=UPI0026386BFF|nr:class I SAM-dependent methyltransferase [Acaryochloris sp. IP29b_bin.137]
MLNNFLAQPNRFPLRRMFWRFWYNYFASRYQDINIVLMNYGYTDFRTERLQLDRTDERERYCIQLYHYVTHAVPLEGLDVLEVGCGRGGGASYMRRYLNPQSVTGIDFSASNIHFCRQRHQMPGLEFSVDDAESLSLPDHSFDAVVNIESSHCYRQTEHFFSEVFRVLRPQGYFLFADFRPQDAVDATRKQLIKAGFSILKQEAITANVLAAMDLENERKLDIIKTNIPTYFHGLARWFAGIQGSPVYEAFNQGDLEYWCYILQRSHPPQG